jgi:hypothetical protein
MQSKNDKKLCVQGYLVFTFVNVMLLLQSQSDLTEALIMFTGKVGLTSLRCFYKIISIIGMKILMKS